MNRRTATMLFLLALGPLLAGVGSAIADDDEQEHDDDADDDAEEAQEAQEAQEAEIDDDHDTAREAVEANEAISLGRMLDIFEGYGHLTVVDVALVTRRGALQYRIKYIDPAGRVRQRHFNAGTGELEP